MKLVVRFPLGAWRRVMSTAPLAAGVMLCVLSLQSSARGARAEEPAPDSTALTDDRSTGVPTGWWAYTSVSAATLTSLYEAKGARLTDIEVHSIVGGAPRFTARMVQNSGAYAVPGWWWYYGLSYSQVGAKLGEKNARLIDLDPYDAGGGAIRYAAVMVSNTGSAARAWWWYSGVTSAQIGGYLDDHNARLIDLDTYYPGGEKRYSAVMVSNTGADAKGWQWWLNQTEAGVNAKVAAFTGRIVDIERLPDGKFNVVLVRNTGSDSFAWWWYYGFPSITDLLNYANQLGVRPVDIETYVSGGSRRYMGVFIENSNATTRRIFNLFAGKFLDSNGNPTRGIFEAYLKQVGGSVLVDLNSARPAETASSLKALHLLHAMKQVQANPGLLDDPFVYYDYRTGTLTQRKNACPDPSKETSANKQTDYDFEKGLDEMMRISDNRATRGVVLKYGFTAINATADAAGMVNTDLRHNIGCAYRNLSNGKYEPQSLRNNTTAADLATLYERVWLSSAVGGVGRTEFLESANPSTGVSAGSTLDTIIKQEATSLGKSSSIASQFAALVKSWSKGGSYGTCLPDEDGDCGQKVIIRSGAGIIQFPVKARGRTFYRTYVFGRFISDVPVTDFTDTYQVPFENPYNLASNELYREAIRSALATWPNS